MTKKRSHECVRQV